MPDEPPLTETKCRHWLRNPRLSCAETSHRKRQRGLWVADMEMQRAYGPGYRIDEDLKARLYNRVLFEVLRTRWFERRDASLSMDVIRRRDVISELGLDPVVASSEWGSDVSDDEGLEGSLALVLDSGRRDGVTEACCRELSRQGCRIALVYDAPDGYEAAFSVKRGITEAGGKCEIVGGCPFRYEAYSNGDDAVRYIGKTIRRALLVLEAERFNIIGNLYPACS